MNEVIRENLETVESRIKAACERCGRDRSEVTLIAVSKTHPAEMVREAYDLGIRQFGENKVQELQDKIPKLPDDTMWHMIGHLQHNKVKYIAGSIHMIHSVDSLRLACTIEKEAAKHDRIIPVLIEVNVADEESKFGVSPGETKDLVRSIAKECPHLQIRGLMTVAPYVEDAEENRGVFKLLRKLSVDIDTCNIDNVSMSVLSMGMTGDYEVAIEEGATHIRVGTGIFGARDYGKK